MFRRFNWENFATTANAGEIGPAINQVIGQNDNLMLITAVGVTTLCGIVLLCWRSSPQELSDSSTRAASDGRSQEMSIPFAEASLNIGVIFVVGFILLLIIGTVIGFVFALRKSNGVGVVIAAILMSGLVIAGLLLMVTVPVVTYRFAESPPAVPPAPREISKSTDGGAWSGRYLPSNAGQHLRINTGRRSSRYQPRRTTVVKPVRRTSGDDPRCDR